MKFFALKISVVLFVLGLIACCDSTFWVISDYSLEVLDAKLSPSENNSFETDTLVLHFIPEVKYFTQIENPFTTPAYALSCPERGENGIKEPLAWIKLKSDHDFNNYPANQSLNDIVRIYSTISNTFITPEQWVDELNVPYQTSGWLFDYQPVYFYIIQKPAETEHTFTLIMHYESGSSIEQSTETIFWQ
ncbi:MAG: hypothetical protein R2798_08695 [Chitinophagales bacterium]|nr:hypothetical protein [Bacteroidota bacterium]MCB9043969.1 hypothetical protein [Chitinophagales bacterium]